MIRLLVFCALLAFNSALFAQAHTVGGVVYDENMEPLPSVHIVTNELFSTTDIDGKFRIEFEKAGTYTLAFSYIGYKTDTVRIHTADPSSNDLQIQLSMSDNLLETATISTSRYEKPLSKATVSLEVIKPQLIKNANTTSLDELLNKVPGVIVNGSEANIRGGSGWSYGAGSRVLLLLDDVPILQADAGVPNFDDLPMENIAQMEVVKGAASALYGSSALNGVINVRTAYAKSKPETEAAVFYGLYQAPREQQAHWWRDTDERPFQAGYSFAHRRKIGKWDLVLGSYGINRNSFNRDAYSRYTRFNAGTRYRVNNRLTLAMNGNVNVGESQEFFYFKNDSSGVYEGDTTTLSLTERLRFNIDPRITYFDASGNRHRLIGRIHRVDNTANNNQSNKSWLYYGEYQFNRHWKQQNIKLTGGLVYNYMQSNAELYGGDQFNARNMAFYLQAEKELADKLILSGGFRWEFNRIQGPDSIDLAGVIRDNQDINENKPVARLGLNYQASNTTFIRASWGQGYRFPVLAEKFISTNSGGLFIAPNPDLESETGWSAEIGIKQGLTLGKKWSGYIDLSAFQSEYKEMIEFNINVDFMAARPIFFQARNIGDTRIQGLELSVAGQGNLGNMQLSLIGGYTYLMPTFQAFNTEGIDTLTLNNFRTGTEGQQNAFSSSADRNILKYRYQHLAKMDVQLDFPKGSIGMAYLYSSRIEAIDIYLGLIRQIFTHWEANQRGNHIVDVRASYKLSDHLKLSVLANNILNQSYFRRPGVLEPTMLLSMRMDATF